MTWEKISNCKADELPERKIIEVEAGNKIVAIVKLNSVIFAFSATCPHAGARLCEGHIDALGQIVCPLHHYKYVPKNGYNKSGEGYKLKTYPTKNEDNTIFIFL